jgi:hypothetical protein
MSIGVKKFLKIFLAMNIATPVAIYIIRLVVLLLIKFPTWLFLGLLYEMIIIAFTLMVYDHSMNY